jgi:hypothetical protein
MSKFLSERKSLPVLMKILGTTVFLLMLCSAYLQFHYSDTRPILEEKEVGRTYPLNVHGRIVYLTQTEKFRLNALEGITVAFGLSFCALGLLRPKQTY